MPEEKAEIFADASKIPFQVRPIDLHGDATLHHKPVSLSRDLSGDLTLSSKHVAFPLEEFVQILGKKNISAVLGQKGGEDIILRTETVLQMARAPDAEDDTINPTKFWAVPAALGFLLGVGMIFFGNKNPGNEESGSGESLWLFFGVAIAAMISGFSAGFLWREFWENMLKEPFQKWAKDTFDL